MDGEGYYRGFLSSEGGNVLSVVISPRLRDANKQLAQVAGRLSHRRGKKKWAREISATDHCIMLEECDGKETSLHYLFTEEDRFIRLSATRLGNQRFSERERHRYVAFFESVALYSSDSPSKGCAPLESASLYFEDPSRSEMIFLAIPSKHAWGREMADEIDPDVSSALFYPWVEEPTENVEIYYHRLKVKPITSPMEEKSCYEMAGGWVVSHPNGEGIALIEEWNGIRYFMRAVVPSDEGRFLIYLTSNTLPTEAQRALWAEAFQRPVLFKGSGPRPSSTQEWKLGQLSMF